MRHTRLRAFGAFLALSLALLAACGDDDSGSTADGGSTSPLTTSTTAVATTAPTTTAAGGPTTVVVTTPPGTDLGQPKLDDSSTVSTTGLDTVLFGMRMAQAEVAAGSRLLPDDSVRTSADCAVVRPEHGPAGVSFTIKAGTIERVDIGPEGKVRTRSGAGVGTTVAQLQSLFGARIAAAPNGTTYVFTPVDAADAAYRVVFETDGTKVTSFRAGRTAVVTPATPCTSG